MTDSQNTPQGTAPQPPRTPDPQHAANPAAGAAQPGQAQQAYYQQYQQYQQPYQGAQPAGAAPRPAAGGASSAKHGGARTFGLAFAGAAVACVIGLGGFAIYQGVSGASHPASTLGAATNTDIQAQQTDATLPEAVAQKALPSVAAIDVYTEQQAGGLYGMYGYGYGGSGSSGQLTESSLGSGVVLTADGYIVTNNHVVEGADALRVTIDGQEYEAEVVGTDPSSDLAVVKAKDASGLTPIELGNSDDLTIGEWVMSIGSPFGLEQSVATGIVSATSRSQIMDSSTDQYGQSAGEPTIYPSMIQTDAAINPGNSGGALVDEDGKLIGINTLITSYSGNYSGVGFAIPVNYAVNIAQQIIDGKTPTHAALGVSLTTVNDQMAKRYGLSASSGAYIAHVQSGSGAAEAGVQEGDIVTKFDGQDVSSASDLMLDVRSKNPGDSVKLTVDRDGKSVELDVTLGSDESTQAATQQQSANGSGLLGNLLGGGSTGSLQQGA